MKTTFKQGSAELIITTEEHYEGAMFLTSPDAGKIFILHDTDGYREEISLEQLLKTWEEKNTPAPKSNQGE